MEPISLAFISAALITFISFVAAPLLLLRDHVLRSLSVFLVALAASALLGTAFLHILPEVMEQELEELVFLWAIFGFVFFYVAEKLLHLHHVTEIEGEEKEHTPRELGILGLLGDFLHNFIDGVILAAAFLVDIQLGFVTAIAIALHEIPQEIAVFGVLVYSGFSKLKSLILNFLSQTSIILGVLLVALTGEVVESRIASVLLFAVGSFVYLGAADFVPEFRRERDPRKSLNLFLVFLVGLVLVWLVGLLE
ncbi:MAG: putative divalent heavy-metal cations transporter [Parcubacteria group bacterium Gr01-1014_30]|nr:MAG: putative divalent heavy-metal cations transporter [Parcubacteria group bacterium Gr01-1014_30]